MLAVWLMPLKFCISIHALREEGNGTGEEVTSTNGISIHALREEGDPLPTAKRRHKKSFLSTPSARRRQSGACFEIFPCTISIHALREEGDKKVSFKRFAFLHFYPRPPRGGRPAVPFIQPFD